MSKLDALNNPYPFTGPIGSPDPAREHYTSTVVGSPHTYLSVSAIERLAKAGVNVQLGPVYPQEDMPATDDHRESELDRLAEPWRFNNLARSVWDRWLRARRALRDPDYGDALDGQQVPFVLLATQHGDTVHLSVHPNDPEHEPFILTDNAIIFPSDALMAKLALWQKEHNS